MSYVDLSVIPGLRVSEEPGTHEHRMISPWHSATGTRPVSGSVHGFRARCYAAPRNDSAERQV
jgi:hypothetical protein